MKICCRQQFYFYPIFLMYLPNVLRYHHFQVFAPLLGINSSWVSSSGGSFFRRFVCTIFGLINYVCCLFHGYSLFKGCDMFLLCFPLSRNFVFSTDIYFTLLCPSRTLIRARVLVVGMWDLTLCYYKWINPIVDLQYLEN